MTSSDIENPQPVRPVTRLYQIRRALILLGLLSGPIFLVGGSMALGRWPQGLEWLETVMLVPLISLGAGGAVAGFFVVLDLVLRRLGVADGDTGDDSPST